MAKIFFLADAHIRSFEDAPFKDFKVFSGYLDPGDSLYILGDFFDFFYGSGGYVPCAYVPVLEHFKLMSERGVKLFFVEGNREFFSAPLLLRFGFAEVKRRLILDLDGRILLIHGDGILSSDWRYRTLRRLLRNPFAFALSKVAGGKLIYSLGFKFSKTPSWIPGATHEDYIEYAKRCVAQGYSGVIMGHTHRGELLRFEGGGFYANPGGWFYSRSYLVYDEGKGLSMGRFWP